MISAGLFSSPFTSNFAPIIISLTLIHVSVCRLSSLTFIVETPSASAIKGINWSPVWLSTGILGLSSFKRFEAASFPTSSAGFLGAPRASPPRIAPLVVLAHKTMPLPGPRRGSVSFSRHSNWMLMLP